MRKLLLIAVLIISLSLAESNIYAQSFDSGTIGIELNDFGRLRVHKPAIGTRMIDRSSILVGVSQSAVFDYTNDADTEVPSANVSSPQFSDFEIEGVFNNNFSNASPDVLVTENVYGWTNQAYSVLKFTVQNLESSSIAAVIGLEILPQVDNAYGNEVCEYSTSDGIAYFHKTNYVGYKLLSGTTNSVKFLEWFNGYSTDANLWDWLSYGTIDVNYPSGADGAIAVMAQPVVNLEPNAVTEVYYAVAVGDDQTQLFNNINAAEQEYLNILPVELTSFTAVNKNGAVELNWQTASELNNLGFEIERKIVAGENSQWNMVGFKEGKGNTTEITNYLFVDDVSELNAATLLYRLKQIDFNGAFEYSDEVEIDVTPSEFELYQNYPNPFNPATQIEFSIPEEGIVSLKIFNAIGEEVATLANQNMAAGNYTINFDASELTSGMYFYTIKTSGYTATKKMMLIK